MLAMLAVGYVFSFFLTLLIRSLSPSLRITLYIKKKKSIHIYILNIGYSNHGTFSVYSILSKPSKTHHFGSAWRFPRVFGLPRKSPQIRKAPPIWLGFHYPPHDPRCPRRTRRTRRLSQEPSRGSLTSSRNSQTSMRK